MRNKHNSEEGNFPAEAGGILQESTQDRSASHENFLTTCTEARGGSDQKM